MNHNLINQPLAKLDYKGKYKDINLERLVKIEAIKAAKPEAIVALMDLYEAGNKKLQSNWDEIKGQLAFTIENYSDGEFDTSIAHQVLEEMEKLEGGK